MVLKREQCKSEQWHVIKDECRGIVPVSSAKIGYVPAPPTEFYIIKLLKSAGIKRKIIDDADKCGMLSTSEVPKQL